MLAREESTDLLRWMVEQYSPSYEEGPFSRALADRLDKLGWRASVDEVNNTIASYGDGDTTIAYLGHIDTVPGNIPVRVEGNRLFGRGSVDAKGGIAAFVAAVHSLSPEQRRGKRFISVA